MDDPINGRRPYLVSALSTVDLDDGTLLTIWYEALKGNPMAVLRQARWRIAG